MATSGNGSSRVDSTGYITLRLSWQQLSQDVGANKTRIRLTLQVITNQYGAMYGSASLPWSINCNGTTNGKWSIQTGANTTRTIGTRDVDITHNADGSKSFSASASATFNMNFNGWVGSVSVSVSGTLNKIARASKVSVSGTLTTGNTITINTNRASSGFTHTIRMNYGYKDIETFTGVGGSVQSSLPTSKYAPMCTDKTSRGLWIYCKTFSGGKQIGSETMTSVTLKVADSVKPTISSVSATDANGYYSKYGGYVQGKSSIKLAISAAGAYGSTIKTVKTTVNGRSVSGTSVNLGAIDASGNVSVSTKVTDSRGRTATKTTTLNVLAYEAPKFTTITAARTPNDESSTVRLTLKGSTTNLGNKGTNTAQITIERRQQGQTSWTQVNSANRGVSWNYTYDLTNLTADMPWEIRVTARDQLNTSTINILTVNTASPILDFKADGTGIGLGAIAVDKETVNVGWRQHMLKPRYFSACGIGASTGYAKVCSISFKNNVEPRPCTTKLTIVQRNRLSDVWLMFGTGNPMKILWSSQWSMRLPDAKAMIYYDIQGNRCDIWVSQTDAYDRVVLADIVSDPVYGASDVGPLEYSLASEWSATLPATATEISRHLFIEDDGIKIGGNNGLTIHNGALNWVDDNGLCGMVMKTIWTGSWSSGSITVNELKHYNLFVLDFANADDALIAPINESGSSIRGACITPYFSSTNDDTLGFRAVDIDVSGTKLTMVKVLNYRIYHKGNNTNPITNLATPDPISRIRGVL